jgi:hypothetical protein
MVRWGVAAAVVAVVAQSAAHLAYVFLFDADVPQLNIDAEANTWAWMSSSVMFGAGLMALLNALADRARTLVLLALAAVLVFFSLDDAVSAHEELGGTIARRLGLSEEWADVAWPAIFLPLFGLAFVTIWQVSRESPPNVRAVLRTGLGLLVSAVVTGLVSTPWYEPGVWAETSAGAFFIVVEEGAELGGWILVGTGLAALAVLRIAAAVSKTQLE